ncbi:uncharacterized protein LOC114391384 isoform X1 [Glycine soja]|uniref:DUF7036 domain-containing protein n=3 Tax=Glycine subgen. Soja TaxID=1462606 RepID=A0A0R0KXR6_SOYBN|nr:uncharacterized protein LOC100786981 isoform X1 [Glycine max]XP_028208188.1 uncharacterized protein LOC114391384 isoform X1 [Glycine soja]|eukprot:XP_014623056.1 uncharacterized protein LOC100786981 isoform X1 [Glycine max]
MGKPGEDHLSLPSAEDPRRNAAAASGCAVGLRCLVVLLFSVAVFLSALFWLPPFAHFADPKDLYLNSKYKGKGIQTNPEFGWEKPVSLLEDNILQLSNDIFEEIGAPSTKVIILSLDPLPRSNTTKVVFAVDPDGKYSEMSAAAISLIRASFKYLVIRQSYLQLTTFLFGVPSVFEVLKFKGGITIIPQQSVFPLQTVQTLFNFTLNFSIYEIQSNFDELTSQLKSGLHLAPYENLYVILSNSEGSTVVAPTVVQSSVLLAVGIPPSKERLKQLAQTIMGHHSWNLGLNNTQFGRAKQVRLSSILQHSLHGSGGSGSPSPSPLPYPHHHYHHHHHHQSHHHNTHVFPETSPAPTPTTGEGATLHNFGAPAPARSVPAPGRSSYAQPPNCRFAHVTPAAPPTTAPHYPVASPWVGPPAHGFDSSVPALSPLPNVAFAHAEPPPKNEAAAEHLNSHFHGPSPSSSSAGCAGTVKWTSLMFLVLVLLV